MTRLDVMESVCAAEGGDSKLTSEILKIEGMSSPKVRHLLNNLGSLVDGQPYVEVGVLKGATLISAAHGNPGRFIGIDNFSQFDGSKTSVCTNMQAFSSRAELMECDFLSLDQLMGDLKPGLIFYDADHTASALRVAMDKILPSMMPGSVLVLDDYNHDPVWSETRDIFWEWIDHLNIRLDLFIQLPARFNGDKELYWNGIGLALF